MVGGIVPPGGRGGAPAPRCAAGVHTARRRGVAVIERMMDVIDERAAVSSPEEPRDRQDLEAGAEGGRVGNGVTGRRQCGVGAGLAAALERGTSAFRVHRVSAHTGSGWDLSWTKSRHGRIKAPGARRRRRAGAKGPFFGRRVAVPLGRRGLAALTEHGSDQDRFAREAGGFDDAVAFFPTRYRGWLCD